MKPSKQIEKNQYRVEDIKKDVGYMKFKIHHVDPETTSYPLLIGIHPKNPDNIGAIVLTFEVSICIVTI